MKKLKFSICKGCLNSLNYQAVSALLCQCCEEGGNFSPITVNKNYAQLGNKLNFIIDPEGIDYLQILKQRRDWQKAKNDKRYIK